MVEVIQHQDETGVEIRLPPVVDMSTTAPLRSCIRQLLLSGHRTLRFDMSEVTFIDADGLEMLADAQTGAKAFEAKIKLVDVRPQVRHILDLAGMDGLARSPGDREPIVPPYDAA